ncbi:MAG: energy-coupling factor transporter ATPase [Oscillospiraceae bacterium]|nr:energy-coupling factor transporter ATPase [Oscillospiraceae bacterium]
MLIETENLSYKYPRGKDNALNGINVTINKGEFTAVVGHNGSGKSTLAKHFNALLLPDAGVVTVDGVETANQGQLFNIRTKIGMVFQNPDNQIVGTVVEEDVAFGPENLGIAPDEIARRVDKALATVDMEQYRKRAPHQLSGGQKQRVSIAGILAMNPECIVLDEATSMLDPKGRKELLQAMTSLNKSGTTIVNITHFMEEAAIADRVIIMKDGNILLDGTPREVFADREILLNAGLDVPPVSRFVKEIAGLGLEINDNVISEQECVEAIETLLNR